MGQISPTPPRGNERQVVFYPLESDVVQAETSVATSRGAARLEALTTLAWYLRERDSERAQILADEVEKLLKRSDSPSRLRLHARLQLVRAKTSTLFAAQTDGYALVESAAQVFRRNEDIIGLGDTFLLQRFVAHEHGDMDNAIAACDRARECFEKARDSLRAAIAEAWAASLSAFRDVAGAEATAQRLRATGITHPSLQALLFATEGVVASRKGDLSRAARSHFQASQHAKQAGMRRQALISALNSAGMLQELGDYDGASELIDDALILAKASNWPIVTGLCMMRLGELLQFLGELDRSYEILVQTLPYFDSMRTGANKATVYQALGETLLAQGKPNEALEKLTMAAGLFRDAGHLQGLAAAAIGQAKALSAAGRPEDALTRIQPLRENDEREYAIQTARALAEIHARHHLPAPPNMRVPTPHLHYLEEALAIGELTVGWNAPTALLIELADAWQAAGDLNRSHDYLRRAFSAQKEENARHAAARAMSLEMRHEAALSRRDAERERDQAIESSRLKSEFVATMSHEIRTPMNGVIGMSDILAQTPLSAEQQEYVSTIRDSANALLGVINDILDFSKIEAGRLELEAVDFDAVRVIESVADLLASQAHAKQLSLMTYVDPAIPRFLVGDPGRFRQILMNLVGNAIKFTERGSVWIVATLEKRKDARARIRVEVRDTGIGMPQEVVAKLFRPFMQADRSTTRRFGGSGLGLSISKRLVELMDGTIKANSKSQRGSTFTFSVWFDIGREPSTLDEPMRLAVRRALVVDDDRVAGEILCKQMSTWGLTTVVFASAAEALEALRNDTGRFDLALIDLSMPKIDGLQLGREIRKDRRLERLRLIMITSFDDGEVGKLAIASGFSAFLTKPVRQSQLFDCIASVMEPGIPEPESPPSDFVPEQGAPREGRILIAEDNAVNQRVARKQLERLITGEIVVVANGKQAVEAVSTDGFALVFMDCQMPIMDGFAATRVIRKAEALTGRHVPIIAMTANALEGDREACLMAGMDDYIAKPVQFDELRRAIMRWLPEVETTAGIPSATQPP